MRIQVFESSHTTWIELYLIINHLKRDLKNCVEHLPTKHLNPDIQICLLHTTLLMPLEASQTFTYQIETPLNYLTRILNDEIYRC